MLALYCARIRILDTIFNYYFTIMRRKTILTILIIFLFLIVGAFVGYLYLKEKTGNVKEPTSIKQGSFSLTYSYLEDNTWEYSVTGTLPTPCYSATTEAIVMESYPEQVQIKVKTKESSDTEVCITVVKDYAYTGTFSASSKASVSLVVE